MPPWNAPAAPGPGARREATEAARLLGRSCSQLAERGLSIARARNRNCLCPCDAAGALGLLGRGGCRSEGLLRFGPCPLAGWGMETMHCWRCSERRGVRSCGRGRATVGTGPCGSGGACPRCAGRGPRAAPVPPSCAADESSGLKINCSIFNCGLNNCFIFI